MELTAHIIGGIAAIIGFYSLTQKNDEKLFILQIIMNALLIPHFWLLGFESSAVVVLLITLRISAAYKYNNKMTYWIFMIAPFFQAGYMYYQNIEYFEYLGVIASLISTQCYFKLKQIPMRIGFIVTGVLWCYLGYFTGSYFIFLMNFIGMILHASTIYRIKKEYAAFDQQPSVTNS